MSDSRANSIRPRTLRLLSLLCSAGIVLTGILLWPVAQLGRAQMMTASPALRKIAEFELPGPPGKRFDYLMIDEDDNYLLSAHLAAGLLHVIDLRTNAVVKSVPGVPGVEGVMYIPEGKKVYTANSGDNTIGVIDLARMAVVKRLPTEEIGRASCRERV